MRQNELLVAVLSGSCSWGPRQATANYDCCLLTSGYQASKQTSLLNQEKFDLFSPPMLLL